MLIDLEFWMRKQKKEAELEAALRSVGVELPKEEVEEDDEQE